MEWNGEDEVGVGLKWSEVGGVKKVRAGDRWVKG